MSNGPSDETADARGDLAIWLDDYTAGRCDRAQMQASFLEICRSNPEAPWDALALLDQYQRRGRVDPALARTLKSDIAQLVFGVVNQSEDEDETASRPTSPTTDPAPVSADTTGTRWRRMAAEQETQASRPAAAFVDPMQFVREAPHSRPMPPVRHPAADESAPGGVLRDRYELLTILGRGNAGTVYKALDRHRAHLDPAAQCVALRVLKRNYRDRPQALGELERQFHMAQSLSHPNIVSVFDLDRDGPTYFLVMELLEGELLSSLLQRLDHRPMPREQALAILGSIGAGLAHAHRRGVVHSDLRPGNVMIAANGEVKLLDTGFARREQVDTHRPEPWIGDPVLGGRQPAVNLAYASEERVNGEPAEAGEDVYSLACIAYELLSGQHPFGGRSAPLARAQGRPPQRIAGLTSRQWTALQTGLKWSRAERKIDVVELIAALGCAEVPQRLMPPQMIVAAPKRRKLGGLGMAALVLLLAGGAAAAYWFNRDSLPQLATPTAPSPPAGDAEVIADPAPLPAAQLPAEAGEPSDTPPEAIAAAPVESSATKQGDPTPAPTARQEPAQQPPKAAEAPAGRSTIAFDKDTFVSTESDGSVKATVKRSGSAAKAVTFEWHLLPNSAEAGNDFAGIGPGTETIPAGARSATITIPLVSDAVKESTELFLIELSDPGDGAEIGEQSRAAIIIVDDD
ncbi:protein kinase domain-containing protein [Povalibacter sp.]|uniref:protein kinase domain-containing protein n=1 Tax=Povalibacter sp. TaxID=1962978 RepID=UPI002D1FAB92|nr:protein kinase [Povalibacter sp.]